MKLRQRDLLLLATAQALMMSGMSLMISSAALACTVLTTRQWLTTLPLAALFIAMMLTTIPAAMLMHRMGRKRAFLLSTFLGMGGATLAAGGTLQGSFWMFVVGAACIGMFNGFGNYYRFAAADSVDKEHKSRAVSYVLAGGVVAAVVGPNLANWTRDLLDNAPFAGSYIALGGLYVLSFVVLSFLHIKTPDRSESDHTPLQPTRPLTHIIKQPKFITALLSGMLGYGVMNLIMTATPLAMQHHAHLFSDTAFVIQWHVLGMTAPSFFTGQLIRRYSVERIMLTGAVLGLGCVFINLLGTSVWHFWTALLLLGVSWNFLFIGATTLLTETYNPEESSKTQAFNDFAIFTTVALASLGSGALQNIFGWRAVNLGVLPLLLVIILSIVWLKAKPRHTVSD